MTTCSKVSGAQKLFSETYHIVNSVEFIDISLKQVFIKKVSNCLKIKAFNTAVNAKRMFKRASVRLAISPPDISSGKQKNFDWVCWTYYYHFVLILLLVFFVNSRLSNVLLKLKSLVFGKFPSGIFLVNHPNIFQT
jgi:hypothetical protein